MCVLTILELDSNHVDLVQLSACRTRHSHLTTQLIMLQWFAWSLSAIAKERKREREREILNFVVKLCHSLNFKDFKVVFVGNDQNILYQCFNMQLPKRAQLV